MSRLNSTKNCPTAVESIDKYQDDCTRNVHESAPVATPGGITFGLRYNYSLFNCNNTYVEENVDIMLGIIVFLRRYFFPAHASS